MPNKLLQQIEDIPDFRVLGKVLAVKDPLIECCGIDVWVEVGSTVYLINRSQQKFLCEVIEVSVGKVLLMPFRLISGMHIGADVEIASNNLSVIYPDPSWLGRVINGVAEPIDGKGLLKLGKAGCPLYTEPPLSSTRRLVREKLDLGIKSINTFLPCCKGQRMGVFSGSGIGKSTLLSMIANFAKVDVKIIGLIGERSREVQELLNGVLLNKLNNTIVIVATGDESALMRKHASYLTLTLCEYFRNQGSEVLCIMDSITRFAMAQREIGVLSGELPTNRGYTPSVFAHLPRLLERAGSGIEGQGNITGIFSVLVEGDDHISDPIADTVRSILDGHIMLDRSIAENGRFPAVNILRSVSRALPLCNNDVQNNLIDNIRKLLSLYESMKDMINMGIYKKGSNGDIDKSIVLYNEMEKFCAQGVDEYSSIESSYDMLTSIVKLI